MRNVFWVAFFVGMPVVVHGQTLFFIFSRFNNLTKLLAPLLVTVALAIFFWGIAKFIANADSEQERTSGKQLMLWGVIAFFVTLSIWGLVSFLSNTLYAPVSPADVRTIICPGSLGC